MQPGTVLSPTDIDKCVSKQRDSWLKYKLEFYNGRCLNSQMVIIVFSRRLNLCSFIGCGVSHAWSRNVISGSEPSGGEWVVGEGGGGNYPRKFRKLDFLQDSKLFSYETRHPTKKKTYK